MSQRIISGERRHLSLGRHLIAGAVGVLAGLQHLLAAKGKVTSARSPVQPRPAARQIDLEPAEKQRDFFSVRRTKSELGYVYWVLQGHGEFQCFVLFDTWEEAIAEASRRLSDCQEKSLPVFAGAMSA